MAWLADLVWPEQEERRERLERRSRIARREPPYIVGGDLFDHLPALLAEAGRPRDPGGVPQRGASPTSRSPSASASTT